MQFSLLLLLLSWKLYFTTGLALMEKNTKTRQYHLILLLFVLFVVYVVVFVVTVIVHVVIYVVVYVVMLMPPLFKNTTELID